MRYSIVFEWVLRNTVRVVRFAGFGLTLLVLVVADVQQSGVEAAENQQELSCSPGDQSITVGLDTDAISVNIKGCSCNDESIDVAKKDLLNLVKNPHKKYSYSYFSSFEEGKKVFKTKLYCYSQETINSLKSSKGQE